MHVYIIISIDDDYRVIQSAHLSYSKALIEQSRLYEESLLKGYDGVVYIVEPHLINP